MVKKVGFAFALNRINPRYSVFFGKRGGALASLATHPAIFEMYREKALEALRADGPVDKLAAAYRPLGDIGYVQSNFAEYVARGTAGPHVKEVFDALSKALREEPPVDPLLIFETELKTFRIWLNREFNPTRQENAVLALFDIVNAKNGLIISEIVVDKAGVVKKGVALVEKLTKAKK